MAKLRQKIEFHEICVADFTAATKKPKGRKGVFSDSSTEQQ